LDRLGIPRRSFRRDYLLYRPLFRGRWERYEWYRYYYDYPATSPFWYLLSLYPFGDPFWDTFGYYPPNDPYWNQYDMYLSGSISSSSGEEEEEEK
jgi:hypothetical protein